MANVMFRIISTGAPRQCAVDMMRKLDRHCPKWDIDIMKRGQFSTNIYNRAFADAREKKTDFIILAHDDLYVEDVASIAKLVEHDRPVVDCVLPGTHNGSLLWLFFHLTKDGIYFSGEPVQGQGLVPIYSSQLGLTCYRADVFHSKELGPMLYQDELFEDGTFKMLGTCDIYLCRRLHKANIPIVADMDVAVEHNAPVELRKLFEHLQAWVLRGNGHVDTAYPLPTRRVMRLSEFDLALKDFPVCDAYREYQEKMPIPREIAWMQKPSLKIA